MDLNHLSTFCIVVEAGSISRAAKELFVTQPAISLKVQELEEHYQVQLLDRTNKGVIPTEMGLFVYGEAQKIIALLSNIEREIELNRNPVEDLAVGASSTIGNSALPCTLLIYRGRYPGYNINLDIGNTQQIIEKLLNRWVEIALVEGPLSESQRETLTEDGVLINIIAQTKLILVASCDGKYSDLTNVTIDELCELPLIVREEGSGIKATFEKVISSKGKSLQDFNLIYELTTNSAIVSAISSEIGLSLLPIMSLRKELRHKILKNITLKGMSFKHEFSLLYRDESKKKSHKAFIDLISSKERGFC